MGVMNRLTRVSRAFRTNDANVRLQAALAAGTDPSPQDVPALLAQCSVDPDFFVRDMLTWALSRHPAETIVPLLLTELRSDVPQARSQAMHTCSKIAAAHPEQAPTIWSDLTDGPNDNLLTTLATSTDDEVARATWRTAVGVVPSQDAAGLAGLLSTQLGRGDRELRRSLSRAFLALGAAAQPVLEDLGRGDASASDLRRAAHARATLLLLRDPELSFDAAEYEVAHDDPRR
ncbi:MAG TPA: HEAT repeat domain-containing protein [Candidatus Corynebacterium faecigallinarum]|uniref:HEAT repeat domain-containing protein n=1 Tax=Candidatus Corynebacterium faecigallinarum TaxID=2838528 RepID=A0A9D2TQN0_9CORY|nr:HEAT repeat domain-containing protein [Candidatus Corynebacterium faecigallinarum]